jgi:hypothetical protein
MNTTDSFGYGEVMAIVGCSEGQIDRWATTSVVPPSVKVTGGSGQYRRWSFTDLVALGIVRRAMAWGIDLERFRRQGLSLALNLATEQAGSWDHIPIVNADGLTLASVGEWAKFLSATSSSSFYTIIRVAPIHDEILAKVEAHATPHV